MVKHMDIYIYIYSYIYIYRHMVYGGILGIYWGYFSQGGVFLRMTNKHSNVGHSVPTMWIHQLGGRDYMQLPKKRLPGLVNIQKAIENGDLLCKRLPEGMTENIPPIGKTAGL